MRGEVLNAVRARVAALQPQFAGVAVEERGGEIRVAIPDSFRVGHEAHFAQVTTEFLRFVRDRRALPAWERPNMLAKYYVLDDRHGAEPPAPAAAGAAPRAAVTL